MPQYPVKSVCPVIGFASAGGGGITQPEADARYLQLTGGTLTGTLTGTNVTINGTTNTANLILNGTIIDPTQPWPTP